MYLAAILATRLDKELDIAEIKRLMRRVVQEIDAAPNRVRYTMNGFVVSVGAYVKPLLQDAKGAAKNLGTVLVDVGETACKVPVALPYIQKIEKMGRVGRKRKTSKC
jgi:histone H3/H4